MFATTSTRAEKRIFPRNNKCEPCMHVLVAETREGKGGRDGTRKLRLHELQARSRCASIQRWDLFSCSNF